MASDVELIKHTQPAAGSDNRLIVRGADLVYLAEASHLGLFRLAALLTVCGSGLSICFAAVSKDGVTIPTIMCAIAGIGLASVALAKPRTSYSWLRQRALRQLSPLVLAVTAVLITGPASPCWWLALPLLWVIATVSSTRLALIAACITGCAYLLGTTLAGEPLIQNGNAGIPAGAVALAGNTLVCRLVAELLARFILRLHQLESAAQLSAPVFIPNLATGGDNAQPHRSSQPAAAARLTRLSSRQLQVLLLLRDGLTHAEVAAALGITTRQVERHVQNARERAHAATTGELLALLVTGALAPVSVPPAGNRHHATQAIADIA